MDSNKIASLEGFSGEDCPHLKCLILSNNRLTNLEGLSKFPELEELYLASNQLTSMRGLEEFNNLKKLHMRGNKISGLEYIPVLETVEYLNLRDNAIETQPEPKEEGGEAPPSGMTHLAKLGTYDEESK